MKKLLFLLFFILTFSLSYGQDLELDTRSILDVEDNVLQKYDIKYFQNISNVRLGVGIGQLHINDTEYTYYNSIAVGLDFSKGIQTFEVDGNYLSNSQFIYEVRYVLNPNKIFNIELSSSRNPIGTSLTSKLELFSLSNGITVDVNTFNNRFILVGGYYLQGIDTVDSNLYRDVYIAKPIYRFKNNMWIEFENKFMRLDNTSDLFFTPLEFDKHKLGIGYPFVVFNENAVISPKVSYGTQNINGVYNSLFEAEVKFRGWITDKLGFTGNVIYSNSYNEWGVYFFGYGNMKIIYKFN